MKLTAKETLDIIKLLSVSETLEDFISRLNEYTNLSLLPKEKEEHKVEENKEEHQEKEIPLVETNNGKASIYSQEYASLAKDEARQEKEILKLEVPTEEENDPEVKSTVPNLGQTDKEIEDKEEESYEYLTPEEMAPFGGVVSSVNTTAIEETKEDISSNTNEVINTENKAKTKVLTPQIKNQWEGARTVSPGELNL